MGRFGNLLVLLDASSKKLVEAVLVTAFRYRTTGPTAGVVQRYSEELGLDEDATSLMFRDAIELVSEALFHSMSAEQVAELFPNDFNPKLSQLLSQIIQHHLGDWKEAAVGSQVSLPKLVGSDYRVDIKTSSTQVQRMAVPCVIVDLEVQEAPKNTQSFPGTDHVVFELNKDTLQTMLAGLGQIRDQLDSIT